MKALAILLCCGVAASLTACTTIENRRDVYFPQEVNGPYTRMLKHGVPKTAKTTVTTTTTTTTSDFKNVR